MKRKQFGRRPSGNRFAWTAIAAALVVLGIAAGWLAARERSSGGEAGEPQKLLEVKSTADLSDRYDVIVTGTDPEGIAAAVSAARNGLKTLLVDGREREILGGLFTIGWLNSLDMNAKRDALGREDYFNKGIFKEWYDQVEGDSFDVATAANVFHRMVSAENNLHLLMKVKSMKSVVDASSGVKTVRGLEVTMPDGRTRTFAAGALIDATQDADVAAAAGARFTVGREDIGDPDTKMAVTLAFQIRNVTPDVWKKIADRVNNDSDPYAGATHMSAAGYHEMWDYPSSNPERVTMRGLNIGRQNDNTALINALHIFDVDPFDPASVREGMELAKRELPRIVAYMKQKYPELAGVELGETAKELYVRETRHLNAEYRLTMVDLLENRDHWDRVAFGSYPVDIQRTSPKERGVIVMKPKQYAVPFRSLVPKDVDGLLVVGRSAGFDTLPHGSARVVPVGMATGQAAGAAAKIALERGVTFRDMSKSKELIQLLQNRLTEQKMELEPYTPDKPDYMKHKAYPGLKAAVSLGMVYGGYGNDFRLDEPSNPERMANQMNYYVKRAFRNVFPGDPNAALSGVAAPNKSPLSLDQAALTILRAAGVKADLPQAVDELRKRGWLKEETLGLIADKARLTNGETYLLIRDVIEAAAGKRYD